MLQLFFAFLFSIFSFSLVASCTSCSQKQAHLQATPEVVKTEEEKKEVKSCICTKEFQPVCGEDKNTYSNACSAECLDIKIVHNGACIEQMGTK